MAIINGTSEDDFIVASVEGAVEGDVIRGLGGNDMLLADVDHITLEGGDGDDELFSEFGTDGTVMDGGAGDDLLIGGGTNDTASYANDPSGVTVDLSTGVASDGYGGTDTLFGIEHVIGSAFDDVLIGDDGPNTLQGGPGNDILTGNGGADTFKYSFTFTEGGGGGGGELSRFTDFFAAHGGTVVGGEVADGTKQGQFSSLYTQWLESLGLTVVDLDQNSPDGMPVVEGPEGTFGERESFEWTSGGGKKTVTHERWYSDTWTSGSGGGQDAVTSNDGFDTIVDFTWGEDQLEFNGLAGLTLDQFASFFNATEAYVNDDAILDTMLALSDNSWGVTLLSVSGHSEADFYSTSVFS
ncbi:MAG: hypothetical protein Q8N51_19850 [Gammaproteobacteria bacterium]|nr:hypothetical protein [Gammaproteobacteria bacterium]